MRRSGCTYKSTADSITVSTKPCDLYGVVIADEADYSVTVKDGANTVLVLRLDSNVENGSFMPPVPVACRNGISVTKSGTGDYTVYYAERG